MIFYSATAGGFFDDGIHSAAQIPADAVPIDGETHTALLRQQSEGKCIVPGPDGAPIATDQPLPPNDVLAGNMRADRNRLLTDCDWTQVSDAPVTDEQRAAWCIYRQALRDLPETTADLAAVVWPVAPA